MANFCTKCGTPTIENQIFCNRCGAQIGAEGGPPGPSGSAAVRAAPPANVKQPQGPPSKTPGGVVAAPPKKGGPAATLIIAIVACLAVVSVLGIGSCFYITYRIKQKAISIAEGTRSATGSSGNPELHLSEGGAGSKAAASATIDVPPYPNSTPTESGGELSAGLAGAASAKEYETSDGVNKVESFYRDKFGSKITFIENEGKATFNYLTSQGITTVTIARDEGAGKTKINIARIGK
jgi:hypothetical protein